MKGFHSFYRGLSVLAEKGGCSPGSHCAANGSLKVQPLRHSLQP